MTDEEVKVSVIVPVYNTEEYLPTCLDSIVGQTLREIQIICVDDGSTDASLDILNSYASRDRRVLVLRQRNQFAGMARNLGMDYAVGKYLVFWDSDDFFDPTALEKMYLRSEEDLSDICVCGGSRYYEDEGMEAETDAFLFSHRVPQQLPFNRFTNADQLLSFTTVMIWNKMYRRSFVQEHGLRFKPARNANDVYFSAAALCLADRITVVHEHLVTYRVGRADSLVATLDKNPLAPLEAWTAFYNDYHGLPGFPARSYANKVMGVIRHSFRNVSNWDSYAACFSYLREGGLTSLAIEEREKGYYVDWVDEFLAHLTRDSAHDFLAYFSFSGYRALERETARKNRDRLEGRRVHEREIAAIKGSRAYRMGRVLTAPVRAAKRLVKAKKVS